MYKTDPGGQREAKIFHTAFKVVSILNFDCPPQAGLSLDSPDATDVQLTSFIPLEAELCLAFIAHGVVFPNSILGCPSHSSFLEAQALSRRNISRPDTLLQRTTLLERGDVFERTASFR